MPYTAKQGFQYSVIEFEGEEVYRFKTYSEAMRIAKMLNEAYEKGLSEGYTTAGWDYAAMLENTDE